MGLTGMHLLVVVLVPLVLLAEAVAGIYLIERKATAPGVRDGRRSALSRR